jgi:hypothetical protein
MGLQEVVHLHDRHALWVVHTPPGLGLDGREPLSHAPEQPSRAWRACRFRSRLVVRHRREAASARVGRSQAVTARMRSSADHIHRSGANGSPADSTARVQVCEGATGRSLRAMRWERSAAARVTPPDCYPRRKGPVARGTSAAQDHRGPATGEVVGVSLQPIDLGRRLAPANDVLDVIDRPWHATPVSVIPVVLGVCDNKIFTNHVNHWSIRTYGPSDAVFVTHPSSQSPGGPPDGSLEAPPPKIGHRVMVRNGPDPGKDWPHSGDRG